MFTSSNMVVLIVRIEHESNVGSLTKNCSGTWTWQNRETNSSIQSDNAPGCHEIRICLFVGSFICHIRTRVVNGPPYPIYFSLSPCQPVLTYPTICSTPGIRFIVSVPSIEINFTTSLFFQFLIRSLVCFRKHERTRLHYLVH
jgi:hypothetical protein